MAGQWNSWPREDFRRHIFEAVLKLRQLNVALQKSHQSLVSWTCDQPTKRTCDILGRALPQPTIFTKIPTHSPANRGFYSLVFQKIAASSVKFEARFNSKISAFGMT